MSDKTSTLESAKEAIARLRANRRQAGDVAIEASKRRLSLGAEETHAKQTPSPQRASKHSGRVSTVERRKAIEGVTQRLLRGELTQGQALKTLRIEVLGLTQEEYANLAKVSRKTLSDVENDRGSYKTDILDRLFKPFGLRVGIVPISTGIK
ncbi:helix-turn-helix transcriptional regulator [Shewanella indica]|jgi:DNA-binding XRE family transcriptional regulator|uniref:helix-turn-helix transcriptional regulator n=1 Tax=Shewanella TaxID=22 RepID=UPI00057A688F|nr:MULTISPECIES: helix-turn-helix transcriptional regulator [Shewanella]NDO75768.1 helix-turn-helix transcriptional regulator [Shewanella sp. SE1]TVP08877.1 transcriptional regulator [Shewanella sp. MSW]BCV38392.1 transcriptional regulator [Shewanella chilikensis]GHB15502.1 transcriptional regulator [Shewanella indica]